MRVEKYTHPQSTLHITYVYVYTYPQIHVYMIYIYIIEIYMHAHHTTQTRMFISAIFLSRKTENNPNALSIVNESVVAYFTQGIAAWQRGWSHYSHLEQYG